MICRMGGEPATGTPDLAAIPDEQWVIAKRRFEVIRPLLEQGDFDASAIVKRAGESTVHRSTLYRWLSAYLKTTSLDSLLPRRPGPSRGGHGLTPAVETVIESSIEDRYLTRQRLSPIQVVRDVQLRCRESGLDMPSESTVRRRLTAIPSEVEKRRREGYRAAQAIAPLRGAFPEVAHSLGVVQIDHTPLDLILVDDIHRRPIGKAWLTLAMDVFSRMVAGFSLAFESPSSLSVGLCLTHAILPKDVWLSKHGIATPWPLHGLMDSVRCDNGREFRGNMLRKACEQYAIELAFRPVKRPWYGGHIERLLGTFVKEIHALAGTTFSNPTQRDTYDSEGRAIFTLSEFEAWLTRFIVEVYHQRVHTALGIPPLRRYEQSAAGVALRCPDAHRLKLDFLPYEERSVQRYGLALDGVHYYSDVLRRWIDSREPEDSKRKRAFLIRRDPRDVSVVYFFDPELSCYFEIPYRDTSRPALTLWELREARARLREQGVAKMDEDLIFQAYRKLRTLEEEAGKATRKVRREPAVNVGTAKPEPVSGAAVDNGEDILPFEEIEPWP
jgi:putative transposase